MPSSAEHSICLRRCWRATNATSKMDKVLRRFSDIDSVSRLNVGVWSGASGGSVSCWHANSCKFLNNIFLNSYLQSNEPPRRVEKYFRYDSQQHGVPEYLGDSLPQQVGSAGTEGEESRDWHSLVLSTVHRQPALHHRRSDLHSTDVSARPTQQQSSSAESEATAAHLPSLHNRRGHAEYPSCVQFREGYNSAAESRVADAAVKRRNKKNAFKPVFSNVHFTVNHHQLVIKLLFI